MKNKRLLIVSSVFALIVSGCAANQQMTEQMNQMADQMNQMQMQLNTAEAGAATAKDMAGQAMTKASRVESMMRRMHGKKMMK